MDKFQTYENLRRKNNVTLANNFIVTASVEDDNENYKIMHYIVNDEIEKINKAKGSELSKEEKEELIRDLYSDISACEKLSDKNKDTKLKRFFTKLKEVIFKLLKNGSMFFGQLLTSTAIQIIISALTSIAGLIVATSFYTGKNPKQIVNDWKIKRKVENIRDRESSPSINEVEKVMNFNNGFMDYNPPSEMAPKTIGRKPL